MTRKVIEAFGEDRLRASSRSDESAGPAEQDAPNTIADLRLAYARIIDPETFAELDHNRQMRAKLFLGDPTIEPDEELVHNRDAALAKADRIHALKATHLIGLSQGEREANLIALIRDRDGEDFDGEIHLTSAEGEAVITALSGLSLPGRDAEPWPDDLAQDSDLAFALGRPNFWCGSFAHTYQKAGAPIAKRAEEEQAFIIHRMISFQRSHGDDWREAMTEEMRELQQHIELSLPSTPEPGK